MGERIRRGTRKNWQEIRTRAPAWTVKQSAMRSTAQRTRLQSLRKMEIWIRGSRARPRNRKWMTRRWLQAVRFLFLRHNFDNATVFCLTYFVQNCKTLSPNATPVRYRSLVYSEIDRILVTNMFQIHPCS